MSAGLRPVGGPIDWTPARRPPAIVHGGSEVSVLPLSTVHAAGLYDASHGSAGAEQIWDYLPYGPFDTADTFTRWVEAATARTDPLFFALGEKRSGAPRGVASLQRIDQANGVIEIGHIWFSPRVQRTRLATEALYLLMRHVFEDLGYRRLEWKCDSLNSASRRAAERLGFTLEGVFRQAVVVKGRNRDTAWYSIIDREWGSRARALELWLAADNFDQEGHQRRRLADIRHELARGRDLDA